MPFPRDFTKRMGRKLGWKCQKAGCGRRFADGWLLESHHKTPTHSGGQNTEENFELLCIEHHRDAHVELAKKDMASARLIEVRLKRTKGRIKGR